VTPKSTFVTAQTWFYSPKIHISCKTAHWKKRRRLWCSHSAY